MTSFSNSNNGKSVYFEVVGTPVAKARPRAAHVGGHTRIYTPKKSKDFEFMVKKEAEKLFLKPFDGCIRVDIFFYLPRPKRLFWKTKPMPECYCDKRPDIDNLAKSVLDGLNRIAFRDDGQISELSVVKKYHAGDAHPKTTVCVTMLCGKD